MLQLSYPLLKLCFRTRRRLLILIFSLVCKPGLLSGFHHKVVAEVLKPPFPELFYVKSRFREDLSYTFSSAILIVCMLFEFRSKSD